MSRTPSPSEGSVIYVRLAIRVMQYATTLRDLLVWWRDEYPRRRQYKLSAEEWPGTLLKEAFELRRNQLTNGD